MLKLEQGCLATFHACDQTLKLLMSRADVVGLLGLGLKVGCAEESGEGVFGLLLGEIIGL